MKNYLAILIYSSAFFCSGGTAWANSQDNLESSVTATCLQSHYPNLKEFPSGWGYVPGPAEQEAICRTEFSGPDALLARDEIKGDDTNPLTLEMRKLWVMDRLQHKNDGGVRVGPTIFSQAVVRKPPAKYLEISPGAKPEQVPHLNTEGKRERVPDLLRTLDSGKAGRIYVFHRMDEQLPAVCIEPGEGGACKEIMPKDQYEQQKTKTSGEASGFKRFMGKVKDSVAGPAVKEISEAKAVDFFGVRLADVAYTFDYELTYSGFFARISNRKPYVISESPQYIRDVFGALIRKFGEPTLKGKEPGSGKPGLTSSYAIWLTGNGFRIDASCEIPADDSGICRNGRLAVRRLPAVKSSRSAEGTEFFE